VGGKLATPAQVKAAAFASFGVGGIAGLVLAATSFLVAVAGGHRRGRRGLGLHRGAAALRLPGLGRALGVRVLRLVAVLGTTYAQVEDLSALSVVVAIPVGMLACALLVVNNLRDAPGDAVAGKRTLAVVLGDRRTRTLFVALLLVPFAVILALVPAHPWVALALLALPAARPPVRTVTGGARNRDLIPALAGTARAQLSYGLLLALALSFSS